MDALDSALQEKKNTWHKSCKESAKRETELYKMLESSTYDAKAEDNARSKLKNTLKQLCKERDAENEARALLEEMQQNLDEAHARASET